MIWNRLLPLLLLLVFMANCQNEAGSTPVAETTPPPPLATLVDAAHAEFVPTLPPTVVPIQTSLPVPTLTAWPTSLPVTATPAAPVIVAVAPEWSAAVTDALTQLASVSQPWQILETDAPLAALAAGDAALALSHGAEGELVYQEPIALAVPFTTEWERISLEAAEGLLANGDDFVQIVSWRDMTPDMKALRVNGMMPDDSAYPLQDRLTLSSQAGHETAAAALNKAMQATLDQESAFLLTAVGDIMLDRGLGFVLSQGNVAYPFAGVADQLRAADITVGNVESALGTVGEPAPKAYPFRAPPAAAEALAVAGFDVVSLANNHGMDYGQEALTQALQLLQAQNVQPIGAGSNRAEAHAPYIADVNGLTVALLGYVNVPVEAMSAFDVAVWDATEETPGLAWAEPDVVAADVSAVRDQVDLVIVVLHSGYEYVEQPSDIQVAISHAAIDAGAALVIGHHAHILQGIERYKDGVIVYGLGNFAFEIDGDPNTAILNAWLDADGVRQIELVPAIIQTGGQPRLADEWEAASILQNVYYLTRLLNGE